MANSSQKSTSRKVIGAVLALVQIGLLGAALWDIRQRPSDQINGPKKLWVTVAFINYIGPIAYFILGRK